MILHSKKLQFIVISLVTIISVIYFIPNFSSKFSWLPKNKLNLGLDLQGGSHLLLKLDFNKFREDQLETHANLVRQDLKINKVRFKNLKIINSVIEFELKNLEDVKNIRQLIKNHNNQLNINVVGTKIYLNFDEYQIKLLKQKLLDQSIEIIRFRIDETGTKEPLIQKQGDDCILLQVPGLNNPAELKTLLGKTAKLTFHLIDDLASANDAESKVSSSSKIVKIEGVDDKQYAVIKKKILLTGDLLNDARVGFDNFQRPVIEFSFNNIGAKLFADITKNNTGKYLAILLDDKLLVAPVIREPITGGKGSISGNYTTKSAGELALLLRSGALPTTLKIIEERSVGPSLGQDSINSGIKSGIIGFIGVAIFMIWTYGLLGVFATIALIFSLVYLTAILTMFEATLTLPGIAGIILTIGMAVDANVLIYERIREEANSGASPVLAVKKGFESAFSTIADSNITTLIAALLLYYYGAGAIKGFAVTLTAGVISSMFCAVLVSRILIDVYTHYYKPKKLNF